MKKKLPSWSFVRRTIRPWMEEAGIHSCELGYLNLTNRAGEVVCQGSLFRTLAHSKKVRFWKNIDDMQEVVHACQACHAVIEMMPHDEMAEIVRSTIARRPVPVRKMNWHG